MGYDAKVFGVRCEYLTWLVVELVCCSATVRIMVPGGGGVLCLTRASPLCTSIAVLGR